MNLPPSTDLKPVHLTCEYLVNPIGIDTRVPRLFWKLESDVRGQKQTAYQILVASVPYALAYETGDLWDSGRVESSETTHIEYAGPPLQSRQMCFWMVRSWDRDGVVSSWSEAAMWEMGLLEPGDWQAEWIGVPPRADETPKPLPVAISEKFTLAPAAQLRRVFSVADKPILRARLYVAALGIYEMHIGGQRVGDAYFAPGYTDYSLRIAYQTYDVTELISAGDNVLGAMLADGWYAGYVGYGDRRCNFGPHPQLRAQIFVEYEGEDEVGETVIVGTDDSWWGTLDGPIRVADLQHGEIYDARREMLGWDSEVNFDATEWRPVTVEPAYTGKLVAACDQPVRVTEELRPIAITEPTPGVHIFDMGQNMVGWARLTIPAGTPAGTVVTLRFAEILEPDGTLYITNLRNARQTDDYVVRGDGGAEVWEPRFTFHGFRYVEVTGLPEAPTLDTILGRVAHSDTPRVGWMETSSPMVNQLLANIDWGQRGNFLSVPTDCPQRDERLGWTGDAQIFIRTATYNRDVSAFFTKWLRDLNDAQSAEGAFPDVAPRHHCIANSGPHQEFAGEGTAAWGDAGTICPWTHYQVYGDKRLLAECYPHMKRWVAYCEAHSDNLLRPAEGYGDWLSIDADTPKDVLATAYFAYSTLLTMRAAQVLGHKSDQEASQHLLRRIRAAFNAAYVSPDGDIKGSTQTGYLLALRFLLLPSREMEKKVIARLVADIRARGNHLSTGFVGVGYLCPVLTMSDHSDLAYDLLNQTTFPSWGYSIGHGATTIWERWDGWTHDKGFQDPGMNSFNHYSLGSVGEWLYGTVAGIKSYWPHFECARIAPHPGGGLTHCKASFDSLHGRYATEWSIESDGAYNLSVAIPANCRAQIDFGDMEEEAITEGGGPLSELQEWHIVASPPRDFVIAVDSGTYHFRSRHAPRWYRQDEDS